MDKTSIPATAFTVTAVMEPVEGQQGHVGTAGQSPARDSHSEKAFCALPWKQLGEQNPNRYFQMSLLNSIVMSLQNVSFPDHILCLTSSVSQSVSVIPSGLIFFMYLSLYESILYTF